MTASFCPSLLKSIPKAVKALASPTFHHLGGVVDCEIYAQGRVSTGSSGGEFSAHLFECRRECFRQLFGPFHFGEVRQMGAPKGTGAHGVYGAIELRHDVPFHDVGQFVPALMIGKCLF